MSDATAPAGWYPDPSGSGRQRWWNGLEWTTTLGEATPPPAWQGHAAQRRQPVQGQPVQGQPVQGGWAPGPVAPRPAPAGAPIYTTWIWVITALPLVSLILSAVGLQSSLSSISFSTTDPMAGMAMYSNPAYLLAIAGGWVIYGLSVWFAYLDRSALLTAGYDRPFHWAWTFLSAPVYVIGRSVIVRRRAGRGIAPMWVIIAIMALSVVVSVVLTLSFVISAFDSAYQSGMVS